MNIENIITMINAKLDCMKRDNGCDETCNSRMCYQCSLNYKQGTVGEQKDCLKSAIKYLQSIDDLQKENKRLQQVFDIKDAERAKLVKGNRELQRLLDDAKSDLVSARNDYKQASNEIALLNRQLERQTTSVNDLSDIVETSHKVIDDLKKENAELKLRHKMLTKAFLNSIYGFADTVYVDTDSIKETIENDSNN